MLSPFYKIPQLCPYILNFHAMVCPQTPTDESSMACSAYAMLYFTLFFDSLTGSTLTGSASWLYDSAARGIVWTYEVPRRNAIL